MKRTERYRLFRSSGTIDDCCGLESPRSVVSAPAFTIIEVMIAIAIFAMVLTAIYSTWIAILRGKKSGEKVAAEVQRSRIAIRTLEDAFLSTVMYTENSKYYYFIADSSGDMGGVSMVARLPASFPGVGRYGDQIVRRVSFSTQTSKEGGRELVMTQVPMLLDTNHSSVSAYSIVLAKDVSLFTLEFWDMRQNDWVMEWINTNQLPRLVRISLGLGKVAGHSSQPDDLVSRVVALPSISVAGVQTANGIPGQPGGLPPGAIPPGGLPPGGYPGGIPPGGYPGGVPPGGYPGGGYPGGGYPGGGYPGGVPQRNNPGGVRR